MKNIFSKMKLAGGRDRFSIGLDIGTQSIKSVKLKISGNSVELVAFDLEESQLDPIDLLKKIKHAQNADLVNVSFCGSGTVIRYVNFLRSFPETHGFGLRPWSTACGFAYRHTTGRRIDVCPSS